MILLIAYLHSKKVLIYVRVLCRTDSLEQLSCSIITFDDRLSVFLGLFYSLVFIVDSSPASYPKVYGAIRLSKVLEVCAL